MAKHPAMPLWTDAYLGDTTHLSTVEHGAYLLILMAMWRAGGELPSDEDMMCRITRLRLNHWRKMAPVIMAFFREVRPGVITQARLADELAGAREYSRKQSERRKHRDANAGSRVHESGGSSAHYSNSYDHANTSATHWETTDGQQPRLNRGSTNPSPSPSPIREERSLPPPPPDRTAAHEPKDAADAAGGGGGSGLSGSGFEQEVMAEAGLRRPVSRRTAQAACARWTALGLDRATILAVMAEVRDSATGAPSSLAYYDPAMQRAAQPPPQPLTVIAGGKAAPAFDPTDALARWAANRKPADDAS